MIEMLAPTDTNLYCEQRCTVMSFCNGRLVKRSRASFNIQEIPPSLGAIISICKLTHNTGPSRLVDVSVLRAHVDAAVTERQLHDVDIVIGVDEDGVERG